MRSPVAEVECREQHQDLDVSLVKPVHGCPHGSDLISGDYLTCDVILHSIRTVARQTAHSLQHGRASAVGPVMVAKGVGGDAQQPRASVAVGVEAAAATKGNDEDLGEEVVGRLRTNPAREVPVDGGGVPIEGRNCCGSVLDATMREASVASNGPTASYCRNLTVVPWGLRGIGGAPWRRPSSLREVFERFTDRARRVLVLAQERAG